MQTETGFKSSTPPNEDWDHLAAMGGQSEALTFRNIMVKRPGGSVRIHFEPLHVVTGPAAHDVLDACLSAAGRTPPSRPADDHAVRGEADCQFGSMLSGGALVPLRDGKGFGARDPGVGCLSLEGCTTTRQAEDAISLMGEGAPPILIIRNLTLPEDASGAERARPLNGMLQALRRYRGGVQIIFGSEDPRIVRSAPIAARTFAAADQNGLMQTPPMGEGEWSLLAPLSDAPVVLCDGEGAAALAEACLADDQDVHESTRHSPDILALIKRRAEMLRFAPQGAPCALVSNLCNHHPDLSDSLHSLSEGRLTALPTPQGQSAETLTWEILREAAQAAADAGSEADKTLLRRLNEVDRLFGRAFGGIYEQESAIESATHKFSMYSHRAGPNGEEVEERTAMRSILREIGLRQDHPALLQFQRDLRRALGDVVELEDELEAADGSDPSP